MAITWNDPIKTYFTADDVSHMEEISGNRIHLNDYSSVKQFGTAVYDQVSAKSMPPGNAWSQDWIDNFKTWMDNGYPES